MSGPSRLKADIDFTAKGRQIGRLALPHSRQESAYGHYPIPIACIAGGEGPTVLLTAGNHGDEYEGQVALLGLARELDPARVHGRLIVLPALNYPAALAGTRASPADGVNLNRAFPGDPDGSPTRALAHYVDSVLMPMADYGLDLHSGGSSLEYAPCTMSRVPEDPAFARRLVEMHAAFGAPLAVLARRTQDERTLSAAALRHGVAQIATEIGGGGTLTPATLAVARRGILGLLAHLGVLAAEAPAPARPRFVEVAHADDFVVAPARGLFEPACALGAEIAEGQLAGRIHFLDEPDRPPREVHFRRAGVLVCRRVPARCEPGDCLAHLARDLEPD